jgi:hypothetical protein
LFVYSLNELRWPFSPGGTVQLIDLEAHLCWQWPCTYSRRNGHRGGTVKAVIGSRRRRGDGASAGNSRPPDTSEENGVRKLMAALVTLALIVAAFAVGRASDRDEAVMTVQVSSADHELLEGYFTLGDSATVMAKRGSTLYNFLSRQRGRKVKLVVTEAAGPELSRLER